MIWKTRRRSLQLTRRGVVMGILNTTPDSFSDGGKHVRAASALSYAHQMVKEGAEIIDIGGESTRPGAAGVDLAEEIQRTIPLIHSLRNESEVLISIDTSKASVARAALEAGADIVNDVTGLRGDPDMPRVCADYQAGVCVMHMQGAPRTMQQNPDYEGAGGVVAAVQSFFAERFEMLVALGVDPEAICFDPGIGFGKTLEHNLELLRHLEALQQDRPLLLGVSRKSMISALTGENDPEQRDVATATITALAYRDGIRLHRVHNVSMNLQALRVAEALA
ncbi:MAG: dihydropteroate synthase [Verrucomicrobiae bacterium]|nr:dihydropteroate synthase [Verrucomicrobiae bacterium]NNJ42168.1 dihydropteroate synthase [Akkermansiaceae bacterium]